MADDAFSPDVLTGAKKWGVSPDLYAAEQEAFPGSTIASGLRPLATERAMTGLRHSQHVAPPGGTATALDVVLNPNTPEYMMKAAAGYQDPRYAATFEPKNLTPGPKYSSGNHIHYALKKGPPPPPATTPVAAPKGDADAITGVPADALTKDLNAQEDPETSKLLESQSKAYNEYAEKLDAWDKKADEMFPRYNELMAARKKLQAAEPKVPGATKYPEEKLPPIRDPVQALGTFLPMLAMLGGAMNKRYAMGALKAATGAMKAQKAGDYALRDQIHEQWLDNMKLAIETESSALTEYTNKRAAYNGNLEQNMNDIKLVADQFQDAGMSALAAGKKVEMIDAMLKARGEVLSPLVRMSQAAMLGGAGGPLSEEAERMLATEWQLTGRAPQFGNSRAAGFQKARIANLRAQMFGTAGVGASLADAAVVKGTQGSITDLEKKRGSLDNFITTTSQEALNALKTLQTGGPRFISAFNKYVQGGRKAGGDPEVVKFDLFLYNLREEYARVMAGATGSVAQTSVGQLNAVDNIINGNMAPGQLEAIIQTMIQSVNIRRNSVDKQIGDQRDFLTNLSVGQPMPKTPEQETATLGSQAYPMPIPLTNNGWVADTWYSTPKGPLKFYGMVKKTVNGKQVDAADLRPQ